METVYMGLNTEPDWLKAKVAIAKWKASGKDDMVKLWKKWSQETLTLRNQISIIVERDGECELSWSCTGRTRHMMHARQWAEAMPEYDFDIDYNYKCIVRKKKVE